MTKVKICGIKTPDILKVCISSGARFIGFVFFPKSPRNVSIDTAKELALMLPTGVRSVGLFVDPTDEQLDAVLGRVQIDMIQLHGLETPQRLAQIRAKHHIPVIKAIPVRTLGDIEAARQYEGVVDWLLFDAKPHEGSDIPGGMGVSFDWSLLEGQEFCVPWMLSGGLDSDNLSSALSILSPDAVDVSSGVESLKGVKDADKIIDFIKCAS